jgi:predicted DNA-binding transcriptional regulator AlpA
MTDPSHSSQQPGVDRLIRLKELLTLVPVSKTAWYEGVKTGRYPKPVKLGPRTVAWRLSEIQTLIATGV